VPVKTAMEMLKEIKKQLKNRFDIVIMATAVSDYIPEKISKTKIKSRKSKIIVKLNQAPKIINQIKKIQKDVFLVGFKAETNFSKKALENSARKKIKESNADMIVANDIGTKYQKNRDYNEVLIVNSQKSVSSGRKKKEYIARFIRKQIEKRI